MMTLSNFGQRVREARKRMALTQEELAINLGVTRNQICNIEKGRHAVPVAKLTLLCELLDTTPNDLMGFDSHLS